MQRKLNTPRLFNNEHSRGYVIYTHHRSEAQSLLETLKGCIAFHGGYWVTLQSSNTIDGYGFTMS